MSKLIVIVKLFIAILLVASCGSSTELTTTPDISTTTGSLATTTNTQATTATPINVPIDISEGAPSAEELAELYFVNPELPRITTEKLKQLIDREEKIILIDVRNEYQYKTKRIQQAISLPTNMKDEQIAGFLELPKDILLIFY
jgi:hypothetical protein